MNELDCLAGAPGEILLEPGTYIHTTIGPSQDAAFGDWRTANKSTVAIMQLRPGDGHVDYRIRVTKRTPWGATLRGRPTPTKVDLQTALPREGAQRPIDALTDATIEIAPAAQGIVAKMVKYGAIGLVIYGVLSFFDKKGE